MDKKIVVKFSHFKYCVCFHGAPQHPTKIEPGIIYRATAADNTQNLIEINDHLYTRYYLMELTPLEQLALEA